MKRYTLKSLVQNGSHARKKIKSDVIIGDTNNGYGLGDILDANATMEQVNSKIDDVLGVNAENINNLVEILNDNDAATGILSQLNAKQDAITSDNKLSADLVADGTTNKVFTAAEKTKLSDIATGAEVNVQSDWNQTNTSADDYIKNKPTNVSAFTNDAGYLTENSTIQIQSTPDTNGHTYVDLGLPSGTLWATMNVGASSETDYGNYYKYGLGASQYNNAQANYTGNESPLSSSADTAVQVWGGGWHMPTIEQMQELIDNTTYQWVTNYKGSGINGGTFTATNGAVLFIPAAGVWFNGSQSGVGDYGYCWGSSPNGSNSAYYLYFHDDGYKRVHNDNREGGYAVRPVIESSTITKTVKQILTDAATAAIAAQQ